MDTISDMLTRIRNAQRAEHKEVFIKLSKLKLSIAKILEKEKFIESVNVEKKGDFETARIVLKYYQISPTKKVPAINQIKRVSKQGRRVYVKKDNLIPVRNNFGIGIVSTSQGVMTESESKKQGIGGEYICQVW